MENLEHTQTRLNNIQSLQPILGALSSISLGRWQAARKQHLIAQRFQSNLRVITSQLWPYLSGSRSSISEPVATSRQIVAFMIGSNRGLCGRFNTILIKRFRHYLAEKTKNNEPVTLLVGGKRLARLLQSNDLEPGWSGPIPRDASEMVQFAFEWVRRWLTQYEAHELDAVDLITNRYQGLGRYQPIVIRLIPPSFVGNNPDSNDSWPPPIIETDPLRLYQRTVELGLGLQLYESLVQSAAAEHSTRYQLLEAAGKNMDRLVADLTLSVQAARQQIITQETQALAVGAGLLEVGQVRD